MFLASGKLEKEKDLLKSETLNLFQNSHVNSLSLFFVSPVQFQRPSLYINQALMLHSVFKMSIFISCCP